ncbi:transposase [Streptomyces mirabilis]|uniref:transposase n=1 Tax=Streptomyces mirabilis TaxID=68239 RepID=UPI0033D025E1
MGSKYTKRYTEEFKRDAIALVDSSGKTVTAIARELGISSESLRGYPTGSTLPTATRPSPGSGSTPSPPRRARRSASPTRRPPADPVHRRMPARTPSCATRRTGHPPARRHRSRTGSTSTSSPASPSRTPPAAVSTTPSPLTTRRSACPPGITTTIH